MNIEWISFYATSSRKAKSATDDPIIKKFVFKLTCKLRQLLGFYIFFKIMKH